MVVEKGIEETFRLGDLRAMLDKVVEWGFGDGDHVTVRINPKDEQHESELIVEHPDTSGPGLCIYGYRKIEL